MTAAAAQELRVGRRVVRLSNVDKVLYPAADFTKGDVIHYYLRIARVMLPHLRGRPITLKRYPNGVDGKFFYEKRCPSHRPPWVATLSVDSKASPEGLAYCHINDAASLVWLANLASLEVHPLLSRAPHFDRPALMVFDFDPGPPAGVIEAATIAVRLRDMLAQIGLKSFAKTSGGKGIHMAVPLNTSVTFDDTKDFARAIAQLLERKAPDEVVSKMSKSLRSGKVLVDWSQNDSHKTTACVYSLRARQRPTVSAPVSWKEVESAIRRKKASALTFEADEVLRRVAAHGDLFEPVLKLKQKLPANL
jgi:bifunctional non-homologous end joining protein LigD